ncbi:MAG: hypothetical protein EZS28_040421, partial [Streblomastix strix]
MKTMALKRGGWMARCIVSRRILGDLVWWEEQVKNNTPKCFDRHTPKWTLKTDASETEWGVMLEQTKMQEDPLLARGNGQRIGIRKAQIREN